MDKSRYTQLQEMVDPILKTQWENEQKIYKSKIIEQNNISDVINIIAGVDITFSTINPNVAISTLVVLDRNNKRIGSLNKISEISVPYVPGFLAFREVDSIKELIDNYTNEKRLTAQDFKIDVIFVDGNGILHPNQCGLASHLGVVTDIATIGCAKKIFAIDGINKTVVDEIKLRFKDEGYNTCFEYLKGNSGRIWGAAVKNSPEAFDPLIVSIGHKVDIDTAVKLVIRYSVSRVVQPVRLADKHSRLLIDLFDKFYEKNYKEMVLGEMIAKFQSIIDEKHNK